jgi:hemolysin III
MTGSTTPDARAWNYRLDEIVADGIVHGLGLLLAVAGTVLLLAYSLDLGNAPGLFSHIVYCGSLLVTLTASATYNMWPVSPMKWRLRRVDHAMIFGLIAGTYTPFLIRIGDLETNLFLAAIWIVSAAGIVLKLFDLGRREWLSTVLYIGLGWSGVFAIRTLSRSVPVASFVLILVGGLLYSAGVVFHHWRTLRFQNAIWHGFVLAAASCHFAAVLLAADGS